MPKAMSAAGAVLIPIGFFIVWLTFRENSFAAPVIKIQEERGQRVISTGPYRIVRHPMYAGATLYMVGMPLLFGSWLGLLVLPLILGALPVRIFIEEAALRRGLPGYGEYARAYVTGLSRAYGEAPLLMGQKRTNSVAASMIAAGTFRTSHLH
jgi:protein-S-isoprenylcysteine O-methyltransferase Ste14